MSSTTAGGVRDLRYEPEEQPPPVLALGLGFQFAMLTVAGIVLTPAIVVRAAGGSEDFLSWAAFAALAISGVTTVLQAVRVGRIGSGHVLLMGTSAAFIAVCVTALIEGGPRAPGDTGHALGAVPVRPLDAVVAAPAGAHPDGLRHRDHADPGDPDADHVRHARRRARRIAAGRRAGHRSRDAHRHGRGHAARHRRRAPVGAGHRHRERLRGRRRVRAVQHAAHRRGELDRAARRRLAGIRPPVRRRFLVAAAGLHFRHPDRSHRDHRRQRRHSARLAAQAAGHRLPRRTGRGHRRRRGQPAVRLGRDGAEHDLFVQRLGDGHHRGRLAHRRHLHRRHLPRAGLPPEVHGTHSRDSGSGGRGVHHRDHVHALRARHAGGGRGRRRLPQGGWWRASGSGSGSASRTG